MDLRIRAVQMFIICQIISPLAAAGPTVVVNEKLPANATVGVIPFRDCLIPTQADDCPGSGNVAGPIYATVLASRPGKRVVPLNRPVPSSQELPDDAAVALGRQKKVDFVLNGEVNNWYRAGPMDFRKGLAAVYIRLLKTSDGSVVAFQTENMSSNFKSPTSLIREAADRFKKAI